MGQAARGIGVDLGQLDGCSTVLRSPGVAKGAKPNRPVAGRVRGGCDSTRTKPAGNDVSEAFHLLFSNSVVQILVGIGMMVMLIGIGGRIRRSTLRDGRFNKEMEMRVRSSAQAELQRLRDEMTELRKTLVDHSMSLDRNVELLTRRVEALEESRQAKLRE